MIESKVISDPVLDAHWGLDITLRPSDEAKICIECPLPECKKLNCERFREEKKKLKEKRKC